MNIVVNASTKIVFLPPKDTIRSRTDEDYQYSFGTIANDLADSITVNGSCEGYHYNRTGGAEDILIIYNDGISPYNGRTNALVASDNAAYEKDADGNYIMKITGIFGGVSSGFFVEPECDISSLNISAGDVLAVTLNRRNYITECVKIYDYVQGGKPTSQTGSMWGTDNIFTVDSSTFYKTSQYSLMYPAVKKGKVVKSVYNKYSENYYESFDEAFDVTSYPITVVEDESNDTKVYVGTINDIRDIESVGRENCSPVMVHYRGRVITDIIVFKNSARLE